MLASNEFGPQTVHPSVLPHGRLCAVGPSAASSQRLRPRRKQALPLAALRPHSGSPAPLHRPLQRLRGSRTQHPPPTTTTLPRSPRRSPTLRARRAVRQPQPRWPRRLALAPPPRVARDITDSPAVILKLDWAGQLLMKSIGRGKYSKVTRLAHHRRAPPQSATSSSSCSDGICGHRAGRSLCWC